MAAAKKMSTAKKNAYGKTVKKPAPVKRGSGPGGTAFKPINWSK